MKVSGRKGRLLAIAAIVILVTSGCPLPFDYNGQGAGSSHTSDPSSPKITAAVTISYSEDGGTSGTIANGGTFVTGRTTAVTLSTQTPNSAIYYTDDGTQLVDLGKARKISGSTGSFTITRTEALQSRHIHALAIGPNMAPSQCAEATVEIQDKPVLTISAGPSAIADAGGVGAFTVTSSFPPANDITVNLQTGGTYTAADVAGFPSAGSTLTLTISAGATSASRTVTAQHVPGTFGNKTVTMSVTSGAYAVGTPAAATMTITNTSPVPVLTLGASAPITNGQTATFTVHASVAPEVDHTVIISSSGYRAGKATVPPSVTIPAGATSATFQVTSPSQSYPYDEQDVVVALGAGIGHTLGSPYSQTLRITDAALGSFTYNGVWRFGEGNQNNVGTRLPWNMSGNVYLTGSSLYLGGDLVTDRASVGLTNGSAVFDITKFTIGVKFSAAAIDFSSYWRSILVGGGGWRWFQLKIDPNSNLLVDLNNHAVILPTGMTVAADTPYTLVVNVDVVAGVVVVCLNGTPVALPLPPGFAFDAPSYDLNLMSVDCSVPEGESFKGTWDWVFVSNGVWGYSTVMNIITMDTGL